MEIGYLYIFMAFSVDESEAKIFKSEEKFHVVLPLVLQDHQVIAILFFIAT